MRQYLTNPNDGVISITQCPTAPGEVVVYEFQCTQYGSSWYHSHYALQAWEGVFGGIVVHGPATANYDEDLGSLFLNDWNHETFSALYTYAETKGPPTLDNGLINGTNVYGDVGSRFETTFTSGQSYLIRLVNGAIDTHWDFSIDNHTLTVIATDFVPIVPYTTTSVSIGMGQRYDLIVTADQSDVASDFWLRAAPDTFCSDNANADNILGMIHYDGALISPCHIVTIY
jgi:FtsP/CotA-like multicopper oxidase with cupredoxin domain